MSLKYKVLDLFAGIGGFSLGFYNSGFEIVAAIEQNKKMCDIYRYNFQNVDVICTNIEDIDIQQVPDFDVLIGWLPWISFSVVGRKNISNNILLSKELELISMKRPDIFVLESIVVRKENEEVEFFLENINEIGYSVTTYIIESNTVTGLPIKEKRMYIIGSLSNDISLDFSSERLNGKLFEEIMQDASEIKNRKEKKDTDIELNKRREKIIDPCKDLVYCNYFHVPYVKDKIGIRQVTNIEYLRLKGFPDDYMNNILNNFVAYKFISCATNVSVAEVVANRVKQALNMESYDESTFDSIKQINENGQEFWYARDLQKVLDYSQWRRFADVIEKAKMACENSGNNIMDHFADVGKMVSIGSDAKREINDIELSRYACYLIVMNGDSRKEVIAIGQTYFAIKTRQQELIDDYECLDEDQKRLAIRNEMKAHNKSLAEAAQMAGIIEPKEYAIFQNRGYQGLYGGLGAKDIHSRKELKKGQRILDYMGSTELAANLFRATQTDEKLRRENIKGKKEAGNAHFEVGAKVRQTIKELGGTMPENLPTPNKSVKQIEKEEGKRIRKQNSSEELL